jgi:hypothetical protein
MDVICPTCEIASNNDPARKDTHVVVCVVESVELCGRVSLPTATCPYPKSDPSVLMVQATEERDGRNLADLVTRPMHGCIFVQ